MTQIPFLLGGHSTNKHWQQTKALGWLLNLLCCSVWYIVIIFSKGAKANLPHSLQAWIVRYCLSLFLMQIYPHRNIFIGMRRRLQNPACTLICCGKKTMSFATFTILNETLIWTFPHQAFLDVDIRIPDAQLTSAVENAGARVNGLLAALKAIILVENVVESAKVRIQRQMWYLDHLASPSLHWACTWWATWAPWWPAWPWSPWPGSASSLCQGSTRTTRPRLTRRFCLFCELKPNHCKQQG